MSFLLTVVQQLPAEATEAVQDAALQVAETEGDPSRLILLLTVFMLAVLLGFEIITKIPPTLHTPLMSGSNAISGITLVGAILAAGGDNGTTAAVLGFLAVVFATMNVVGGFVVTNRMLAMFKPTKK